MDRRSFIISGTGALMASACAGPAAMPRGPFFASHGLPIGMQIGLVGPDFFRDPVGTLRKVREIGYGAIEGALGMGNPEVIRQQLDDAGLACTSAGIATFGPRGTSDMPGMLDAAKKMRLTDVVLLGLPAPARFKSSNPANIAVTVLEMVKILNGDDYKVSADFLNATGRVLADNGLHLSYHNHNFELKKFGALSGLEIMIENTDPRLVSFEMDVGWVTTSGADPYELFRKYPGRFTQMHVKEAGKATKFNTDLQITAVPIGTGLIDWPRMLSAAYAAGIRHFYVEQDSPYPLPRLEIAAGAYAYLSKV